MRANRYVSVVMFGPSTTPDASAALTRSATASRAASTYPSARALDANAPPALLVPTRYACAIASITDSGDWVPAAPSR